MSDNKVVNWIVNFCSDETDSCSFFRDVHRSEATVHMSGRPVILADRLTIVVSGVFPALVAARTRAWAALEDFEDDRFHVEKGACASCYIMDSSYL